MISFKFFDQLNLILERFYRFFFNNHHLSEGPYFLSVPPFISEFDMLDVQLREGVNATLECNARGVPKPFITWTYK